MVADFAAKADLEPTATLAMHNVLQSIAIANERAEGSKEDSVASVAKPKFDASGEVVPTPHIEKQLLQEQFVQVGNISAQLFDDRGAHGGNHEPCILRV